MEINNQMNYSKYMRVKIIIDDNWKDFQNTINDWLSNNSKDIIDIQITHTASDEALFQYMATIFYKV